MWNYESYWKQTILCAHNHHDWISKINGFHNQINVAFSHFSVKKHCHNNLFLMCGCNKKLVVVISGLYDGSLSNRHYEL